MLWNAPLPLCRGRGMLVGMHDGFVDACSIMSMNVARCCCMLHRRRRLENGGASAALNDRVFCLMVLDASCTLQVVTSVACCLLSVACYQLDVGAFKRLHFIWCTLHAQARRSDRFVLALRKCLGFAPFGHLHLSANSMAACASLGASEGAGSRGEARGEETRQGRRGERRAGGRERGASERETERNSGAIHNVLTGRSRTSTATLSTNLRACACHFGLPKSS